MKNNFYPLVSIIIPVYNGEDFLESAIKSAINQSYDNIEVIVIDDGSTDNTKKICDQYIDKIRYFKKQNGGVSSALNFGIQRMCGEYFSWLSHDDTYEENKILNNIKVLCNLKNKNTIIFSNWNFINHKGKHIRKKNISKYFRKVDNQKIKYYALFMNLISGCTLLINKNLFKKYGLFDEKLKYTQDYKKWFEFLDEDFYYDHSFDVNVRIHKNQGTNLFAKNSSEMDNLWSNFIEWLNKNNNRDLFLTNDTHKFYYFVRFKNSNFKGINMLVQQNLTKKEKRELSNKIRKYIYDFGKKKYLSKLIFTINAYGIKYTIKKVLNYMRTIKWRS